ncbi:MAG: hypothetical protein IJK23_10010 [Clostridia bacterium]|nr:hypothetical protein [Clostridia bacterium]
MIASTPQITNKGRELLTRAAGGEQITFTGFKAGDGTVPSGTSVATLTDIISSKLTFAVSGINTHTGGVEVIGTFDNSDFATEFRFRELGLFCKGEDNTVCLFAYCNDGDNAGILRPSTATVLSEQRVAIDIAVGNAENITAVLDDSMLYVTMTEFNSHKHSAADITSGILPRSRGGTGCDGSSETLFLVEDGEIEINTIMSQGALAFVTTGSDPSGGITVTGSSIDFEEAGIIKDGNRIYGSINARVKTVFNDSKFGKIVNLLYGTMFDVLMFCQYNPCGSAFRAYDSSGTIRLAPIVSMLYPTKFVVGNNSLAAGDMIAAYFEFDVVPE